MADAEPFPFHATGLRDFWKARTRRAPMIPRHDRREQMLLDALGLGLEQTLTFLAAAQPEYGTFINWIADTAGLPDPVALARYEAALAGSELPPVVRERLAAIDAMPPVLDAHDIAHWNVQGFVVLRAAVTPAQAEAAAALLWDANDARPGDPESWYRGGRTNGIMVQLFQHPALEAARRSARVHKAFAQLWGTSDLWMIVDRMSFNPPERATDRFYAPRLHWDVSLVRPIPFATQGILYLTDTTEDQGALELVPGFHHRLDAWLDAMGEADPRHVDPGAEAIRVPGGAGDLVIWRHDLPHGASPNCSNRPRLAQYVNMYPPWLTHQAEWL